MSPPLVPSPGNSAIVYPSLLAADFGGLTQDLRRLQGGVCDGVHIDVMDGTFVPRISFGDNMVDLVAKQTDLYRDVHLMVVNPRQQIEPFKLCGAQSLTIHQEACPDDLRKALSEIRAAGMRSGVSIKPATPVEAIIDVLDLCDLVLVMSVEPGAGGQAFIPSSVGKIRSLADHVRSQNLQVAIAVDGGINDKTARESVMAGATILVAGSYVFKHSDIGAAIKGLQQTGSVA